MSESQNAPVVLVHGILGFSALTIGDVKVGDYFRLIPDALRQDGHVVPKPPQTNRAGTAADRAETLKNYLLDPNRVEVFGKKVHLVAHSMGGLDSRVMISQLGMADRVLSLTTIATPHHGSPVANAVVRATEPGLPEFLGRLGIDVNGTRDLTTEACAQRNLEVADAPGVMYFSIAGQYRPRKQFILFGKSRGLLGPLHDLIARDEGANDGLVSVTSATMARPAWTHLDTWNVNHFRQVNWGRNLIPTPDEANDRTIVDQYRSLVVQIKQLVAARSN